MTGDLAYHILHITAGSDAGGVSRYIHDLTQALANDGHRATIAGRVGPWHGLFRGLSNVHWITCPCDGGPLDLWRSVRTIGRTLAGQRIDLIHAHYRKSAIIGRRLAKALNVPLLYTLHLPGLPMGLPWRYLSDFGDRTHAACQGSVQWLTQIARVKPDRIDLIPHGIDCSRYPMADQGTQLATRQKLGLPEQATIAAYVGRYDKPKNVDWILDLAEAAQKRQPSLHLVLQGGGPQEADLKRRAEQSSWRDRVTFLPYGDPMAVYQACDAVLLPSSLEGFALVTAEAMSVGRPAIRTDTGGAAEQIVTIDGVATGQRMPIDRTAFIQTAMQTLADRHRLAKMGQAAAGHVRQNLSFESQIRKTVELYRRIKRESPADRG